MMTVNSALRNFELLLQAVIRIYEVIYYRASIRRLPKHCVVAQERSN